MKVLIINEIDHLLLIKRLRTSVVRTSQAPHWIEVCNYIFNCPSISEEQLQKIKEILNIKEEVEQQDTQFPENQDLKKEKIDQNNDQFSDNQDSKNADI